MKGVANMAKYIVESPKYEKFEKSYKLPLTNLIPAFVWNIPIHQKLYPNASFWISLLLGALFISVYVYLSYKPWIVIVPAIAGVIIITAMLWAPTDHIENMVI